MAKAIRTPAHINNGSTGACTRPARHALPCSAVPRNTQRDAIAPNPEAGGEKKAWDDRLIGQGVSTYLEEPDERRRWRLERGTASGGGRRIGEWNGRSQLLIARPWSCLDGGKTNGFRNGGGSGRGRLWFSFLERGKERSRPTKERARRLH